MRFQLKKCVWELTLSCCFSCRYCGSKGGKARERELTTEECIDTARQLAGLGCRRVTLIGGEIFLRPDWDVIAGELSALGIRVSVITNGFLFSEDLISRIKACGIESMAVSLDSVEDIHDKYRQPGSYQRARQAIEILSENDIPVAVISTLNGENIDKLEEFYEEIRDLRLYAWQLQACSPMGNAAEMGDLYRFDFRKAIDFVYRHQDSAPFSIGIADNIGYYTGQEGSLRGNKGGVFSGCSAGLTSIGIDSVGNVKGCEALYDERFSEGNLREKTLREIWESPDSFAYNRHFWKEMLTGKCKTCEHGHICAGGCRSYNYFVHGKMYESPFCAKGTESENLKPV